MQSAAFLGGVFTSKKEKVKSNAVESNTDKALTDEIEEVLGAIKCVDIRFEFETNSDMIESLIFEKRALLSRYRHLLSLAKKDGITCAPSIH